MPISGSSPNKTFSRSDSVRTGSTVWQQSAAVSRGIQPTDQDYHDQDIATAINACWFRDGGNAATSNIPMGTNKFTGLQAGSTSGDSVEYAQMVAAIAAASFPSGTKTIFHQAAAPTGWTQITTINDYALRIVNTAGGGATGGSQGFAAAVNSSQTVSSHVLTTAELPHLTYNITDPGHTHTVATLTATIAVGAGGAALGNNGGATTSTTTSSATTGISVADTNGGGGHTHTFNLGVGYLDFILCSKT